MFQAIAAAFGFATSANAGAQAQYTEQRAEYDSAVGFVRAKDMAYYNTYAASSKTVGLVVLAGLVAIVAVLFIVSKKK